MTSHTKQLGPLAEAIRRGYAQGYREVRLGHASIRTKLTTAVLRLRHREGFLTFYAQPVDEEDRGILAVEMASRSRVTTTIGLKYVNGVPAVRQLRVDPHGGTWMSHRELYGADAGFGVWILSTSKGIRTHQDAIRLGIGGLRLRMVS